MKHIRVFENFNFDLEESLQQTLTGYLNSMLWTEEFDDDFSIDDIDTSSVDSAKDDVDKFLDELDDYDLLDELIVQMSYDSIGHDFWLTRNGHGAGFFDRGLEEVGEEISKICNAFGKKYVYVENEKIYIE